jgi:hypothetical protein
MIYEVYNNAIILQMKLDKLLFDCFQNDWEPQKLGLETLKILKENGKYTSTVCKSATETITKAYTKQGFLLKNRYTPNDKDILNFYNSVIKKVPRDMQKNYFALKDTMDDLIRKGSINRNQAFKTMFSDKDISNMKVYDKNNNPLKLETVVKRHVELRAKTLLKI